MPSPALPEELNDRQQGGAEPLLAIADAAGGEWPAKARAALLELYTGSAAKDNSLGVRLLADIREREKLVNPSAKPIRNARHPPRHARGHGGR
jgi:hypothetical protein